jgi:hypothetical protein
MKTHMFKSAVRVLGLLLILSVVYLGGCASAPPEKRPGDDKIKQDFEKSMQGLKQEEDRQRGSGY